MSDISFQSPTSERWIIAGKAKLNLIEKPPNLLLDGSTGAIALTPYSQVNAHFTDIDIRIKLAMENWNPLNYQVFVARWNSNASQDRAFVFYMEQAGAGALGFGISGDGINPSLFYTTSLPINATKRTICVIRVTMQANNGLGNNKTVFYRSLDDGLTWTILDTFLTPGNFPIADTAKDIWIGSEFSQQFNLIGKVFWVELRNVIDGPLLARFDPNDAIPKEIPESNVGSGIEITNMTSNIILRYDPDGSIWAKYSGRYPNFGSLYLKGIKITVNSQSFIRIYPA